MATVSDNVMGMVATTMVLGRYEGREE